MSRQSLRFVFLAGPLVFLLLAAAALLPFPSSTIGDLGYQALCPFAPWSALMLLWPGGIGWTLHRHGKGQPAVASRG